MTRREIAKKLGLSVAQVRRAENSGLKKLRAALEARGIDAATIVAAYRSKPPVALPDIPQFSHEEEEAADDEEA